MIDFFDHLYFIISERKRIQNIFKIYSILQLLIKLAANILIPPYLILSQKNKKYSLTPSDKKENRIIVSITTFPKRISKTWIIIESMLRQKIKPDTIILWLSIDQFPQISILPKRLQNLQKRGLIIQICESDMKSHKKYFYAMKMFPNDNIITIDDDVFYNSNTLSNLVLTKNNYPKTIICNHARRPVFKDSKLLPYNKWQVIFSSTEPNFEILPIGVGGILYPPNSLDDDLLNVNLIKELCPIADDIWLNVMSKLKGTKVARSSHHSNYLPIIIFKNITLDSQNLYNNFNDNQLNNVRNYYLKSRNVNLYS